MSDIHFHYGITDDNPVGDLFPSFTIDEECEPECPATGGEHSPEEVTTVPLSPSGRCEVWLVCEACGAEIRQVGTDGVL